VTILRCFALWCAIIPFAIVNGIVRERVLNGILGLRRARVASGVLLSGIIFGWTVATITWIDWPPLLPYVAMGLVWLILTVAFEFGFGRLVAKRTWPELFAPYRFEGGDLWPVVLVVVTVSPPLAALLRH
jgi:hypothetical protein